jgi:ferritin-like protein
VSQPVDTALQFFSYAHLPEPLQGISKPYHDLAHLMVSMLPRNPERTKMLNKLLEAKDCAVRAHIFKDAQP